MDRSASDQVPTVPTDASSSLANEPGPAARPRRTVKRTRDSAAAGEAAAAARKRARPAGAASPSSLPFLEAVDESCAGAPVDPAAGRMAGGYRLGPRLSGSPVQSVVHCLAREEARGGDESGRGGGVFLLKMLQLRSRLSEETQDERHGKMLLHTENSLLGLLAGEPGVVRRRRFFTEMARQEAVNADKTRVLTGVSTRRAVLVLDPLACVDQLSTTPAHVLPADLTTACPELRDAVNLQTHLTRQRRLPERDALAVFFRVAEIVARLHARNVVHRDLKLANIVLHRRSGGVTLINFCLGRHLTGDGDLLYDQRGSPAYISPDVLSGNPYRPKPSDMWALGVVLFCLLYGQFPFYHQVPSELFRMIRSVSYRFPTSTAVSEDTKDIVKRLLVADPLKRLSAPELLTMLVHTIETWKALSPSGKNLQRVPMGPTRSQVRRCRRQESMTNNEAEIMINWVRLNSQRDKDEMERREREAAEEEEEETLGLRRRGLLGIPATRIMQDARDLTNEEYRLYGDLICQLRQQNTPGSVSSTGRQLRNSSNSRHDEEDPNSPTSVGGGRVSPVLLSNRSPLHAAIRRQRVLQRGDGAANVTPPVPAVPVAPLVPTLSQEEAVLDLSSGRHWRPPPSSRPPDDAPPLPPISIGLGAEIQLRRLPLPAVDAPTEGDGRRGRGAREVTVSTSSRPATIIRQRHAGAGASESAVVPTVSPPRAASSRRVVPTPVVSSVGQGNIVSVTRSTRSSSAVRRSNRTASRTSNARAFEAFSRRDWSLSRISPPFFTLPLLGQPPTVTLERGAGAAEAGNGQGRSELAQAVSRLSAANRMESAVSTFPGLAAQPHQQAASSSPAVTPTSLPSSPAGGSRGGTSPSQAAAAAARAPEQQPQSSARSSLREALLRLNPAAVQEGDLALAEAVAARRRRERPE